MAKFISKNKVLINSIMALVQAIMLGIYINVVTNSLLITNSFLVSLLDLGKWNLLLIASIVMFYFQIKISTKDANKLIEVKGKIIEKVLETACKSLIYPKTNRHIRAIITMINFKTNKRETTYAYNVLIDPERIATYDIDFGVTGEAYKKKIPVASELNEDHIQGYDSHHQNSVSSQLRSILAVPIFSSEDKTQVIGILAFDSFEKMKSINFDSNESMQIAQSWANVVSEIISI